MIGRRESAIHVKANMATLPANQTREKSMPKISRIGIDLSKSVSESDGNEATR
jgi:hypothetical protein